MSKAFVVLNPVAGNSQPEVLRETLQRRFAEGGHRYELYETTGEERIADVVRRALDRGFDLLIAAGGDGTVSGVADGLAQTSVPLGILPVGTGNVLARDLDIPLDVEKALDLVTGEYAVECIDALQLGDRFFVLNIGVGVSARIMHDTESDAKRRFGRIAYAWNAVARILGLNRQHFALVVDGQEKKLRASELMILNSGGLGSPYVKWGEDIDPYDGQVEIYALRPRSFLDLLQLALDLFLRRRNCAPHVYCLTARQHIDVRADRLLPVQGDGEVLGQTPIKVQIVPAALRVIAPVAER